MVSGVTLVCRDIGATCGWSVVGDELTFDIGAGWRHTSLPAWRWSMLPELAARNGLGWRLLYVDVWVCGCVGWWCRGGRPEWALTLLFCYTVMVHMWVGGSLVRRLFWLKQTQAGHETRCVGVVWLVVGGWVRRVVVPWWQLVPAGCPSERSMPMDFSGGEILWCADHSYHLLFLSVSLAINGKFYQSFDFSY